MTIDPDPALYPHRMTMLIVQAARVFDISREALLGNSCSAPIVRARFAVCWIARKEFGLSFPQIARALGRRDHTTIINAVRRAEDFVRSDALFRARLDWLADLFATPEDQHMANSLIKGEDAVMALFEAGIPRAEIAVRLKMKPRTVERIIGYMRADSRSDRVQSDSAHAASSAALLDALRAHHLERFSAADREIAA